MFNIISKCKTKSLLCIRHYFKISKNEKSKFFLKSVKQYHMVYLESLVLSILLLSVNSKNHAIQSYYMTATGLESTTTYNQPIVLNINFTSEFFAECLNIFFAPASSKQFLDIQATLKRVRDMIRTYSHNHPILPISCSNIPLHHLEK